MTVAIDIASGCRNLLISHGITPVKIGPLGTDDPHAVVGITPYPLTDDMAVGTILSGLQVRVRGNTKDGIQPVLDLQEQILLLMSAVPLALPDIAVAVAWRQSSAPLALDAQGRPEISDNYYLRSDRLGRTG